jgi:hypothetical protein
VVVLDGKAVQLQDERSIVDQFLLVAAAMSSATAEQALIPAAAGFNIGDADERLGTHGSQRNRSGRGRSADVC